MTDQELQDLDRRMAAGSDRLSGGPAVVTADEIRALIVEATRYHWLRQQFESFHDGQYPGFHFRCTVMLKPDEHIPTIDAAIDLALRATA